eukprot:1599243-Rhodomonas_salina.2
MFVLCFPSTSGSLFLPYCRGVTDPARQRLQQWVQQVILVPSSDNRERRGLQLRRTDSNQTETLAVAHRLVGQITEFSNRGLDELVDVLGILLAGTQQWLAMIVMVLQQRRVLSWTHVLEIISEALFSTSEQRGKVDSLESRVEQVC